MPFARAMVAAAAVVVELHAKGEAEDGDGDLLARAFHQGNESARAGRVEVVQDVEAGEASLHRLGAQFAVECIGRLWRPADGSRARLHKFPMGSAPSIFSRSAFVLSSFAPRSGSPIPRLPCG